MTKLLKNNKGFTLVEVIVVAVIVLILAAVAIPLYQGYIKDSKTAVANNLAGTVASALGTGIQVGSVNHNNGTVSGGSGYSFASGTVNTTGFLKFDSRPGVTTDQVQITLPKGFTVSLGAGVVNVKGDPDTTISGSANFYSPTN
ncbi:MAG: prepilin-type N-terminal cleavage/methylation domain-containing protein [Chitinispirillales bacterium]|jgi:prepilin-type N-terminal cleavage/methylation domain-containing protein|nr:prepilin-type N-terminal cleavage/methylation domain-containing protein [Chitinispirillales bacterium]